MSIYWNLPKQERDKVGAKLEELQSRTGRMWEYAVTQRDERDSGAPLLEIVIDGSILRPIDLPCKVPNPAEVLCRELDRCAITRGFVDWQG